MDSSAANTEQHTGNDHKVVNPGDKGPLRVVGIASSAGGLEALSLLVQNLPLQAHAIYVVAQHMSPTHKSVLTSLISRETTLPIVELSGIMDPVPGTIYITPPNSDVVYLEGKLKLCTPSGHAASPKPSADRLFKSIADASGENGVAIVLSGTGSDGSYGVQSIREAGGITIAQEPNSAKYDGMPASAIETGCTDLTLIPEQIGQHFEKILAHPRDLELLRPSIDQPSKLGELIGILFARTHVDFANYKENMLNRRISRRLAALGIDQYDRYVDYCRSNVDEVDALHRDLLISVTRFFRDPDQFKKLHEQMRRRIHDRPSGQIRVWVAGCATGEEAYSIAIMIAEILGGVKELTKGNVQIFATDIDQNAIEIARRGVYPISAAQDIPDHYLSEYFTIKETELTVRQELRNVTLFSRHNIFQDPPFINVDLVTIRNVLIYFNLALQERVLTRLHYSMASGGLLFVGTSETVGEMGIYFEARQGADKVYSKRRGVAGEVTATPTVGNSSYLRPHRRSRSQSEDVVALDGQANLSLARSVAPNGLACTRNGNIVEVIGDISAFSEIRAGMPTSLNVKILKEPLRTEASSLIAVAIRNEERREGRWHAIDSPAGNRVQLQAFPYYHQTGGEVHCLLAINVKFEEDKEFRVEEISDHNQRAYVERMELEIRSTQEALQQTIEELQTANEELQSANEELQSTNEEFQATNEELETSNEELQSTNEELLTVNEELQISSAERQALASELEATLVSSPYAVALADQALIVRRMSRAALELFGLSEIPPSGIHFSQFTLPDGFPALAPIANTVLRLQETRRVQVLSDSRFFTLILSPVLDIHQKLIGLSITVTRFDHEPLTNILDMVSTVTEVGYWTHSLDTRDSFFSDRMYQILGADPVEEPLSWDQVLDQIHPNDRPSMEHLVKDVVENGATSEFQAQYLGHDGLCRTLRGKLMSIKDSHGDSIQLVGVCWDKLKLEQNEILQHGMEQIQTHARLGFFLFDVNSSSTLWNDSMYNTLDLTRDIDEPSFEAILDSLRLQDREKIQKKLQATLMEGKSFTANLITAPKKTRDSKTIELFVDIERSSSGQITHVFGSLRQIEKRRE
ncbi:PAS domain-containing protein [Epibacterium ulvae]|uniref:CheR family methyltransferase n=1 Tax=Epibacterium ulvae TaxID=1156985 RepID=UPI001BFCB189|nr:CheR family methyltransferase [Epibacterium ulvae]MBT8153159.1 PAS domain-containing protein [Epibacterium ulvae]